MWSIKKIKYNQYKYDISSYECLVVSIYDLFHSIVTAIKLCLLRRFATESNKQNSTSVAKNSISKTGKDNRRY